MRFLDANVFVRYLVRDDEAKAQACFDLFQRVKLGQEQVSTNDVIVAEVAYVLSSRALYHLGHDDVRARLVPLLSLSGLKLPRKRLCFRALETYAAHPSLDFEDALAVGTIENDPSGEICSYDRDFDRVPGVKGAEP